MEEYKDKIREKCELYGIDPDVLTDNETKRLVEEIKASEKGALVCKTVLFDVIKRIK